MNYELAKEVKNAGLESKHSSEDAEYPDKDGYVPPNLSELIEACGDGFRSLTYHSKRTNESTYRRWIAKSGARTGKFLRSGHTPEEAVAKLWLALNKK